jgi:3-deoxy-manno-octulosonate cytidylyltransferase (CMP-KDO synthetase)
MSPIPMSPIPMSPIPMSPVIVIPARLAATRLPNKPLADIAGRPMIVRVADQARAAGLGRVVVAAADQAIVDVVAGTGGEAVLTDPGLPSGSDRVYAAVDALDPQGAHDVVVNLQGDLPDIEPSTIAACLEAMADPAVDIATCVAPTAEAWEREDAGVVKAAVDLAPDARIGRALYFSRLPIPSGPGVLYHHIGLYAFRRAALQRFVRLPPSVLERRERLEQLRALADGMRIDAALVDRVPLAVDTPEDLARARAAFGAGP